MAEFKKGQDIIATLPCGTKIRGIYIAPYGDDKHSFYANEFSGIGRNGEPIYRKVTYGLKSEYIKPIASPSISKPSLSQYKAWLKRAIDLENRIDESEALIDSIADGTDKERETKKLERYKSKLSQIKKKIASY